MRVSVLGALLAASLSASVSAEQPAAPPEQSASPYPVLSPGAAPADQSPAPVLFPLREDGRKYWPSQQASAFPFPFWVRAEYLLWWVKDGPATPPLVTTGPAASNAPGVLGAKGTVALFDGSDYDYGTFSGGRWSLGAWFDCDQNSGAEISGFVLPQHGRRFLASSDATGAPVIALPFRDAASGAALVDFASFPGNFAGGIAVSFNSELWGLEGNYLCNVFRGEVGWRPPAFGDLQVDLLAGFRYADLHEDLEITQGSVVLPGGVTEFNGQPVPVGSILVLGDGFNTRNQFYGGQIGARAEFARGPWFLDLLGKVALGDSHQAVDIRGTSTQTTTTSTTVVGGFLATSTNIGGVRRDRFAVLPELDVNLGYQLCPMVRVFAGYTFLYWSEVARPGDQIDTTVNLTRVPTSSTFGPLSGPARPALPFKNTDFWAQGVTFGVEFRY